MSPPVVLFDLDGPLADNANRQHFLATGKNDWDSFFEAQSYDTPNASIVALYKALFASDRFEVIALLPENWIAVI